MSSFKLLTAYSPWFLLVCLAAGAFYAWLLYSKNTPLSPRINKLLAALRFVVVSFLCFLLLGPFVRTTSNTEEKPAIVLALDNSQSVGLFTDSTILQNVQQRLEQLRQKLEEQNFAVSFRTLQPGPQPDNIQQVSFTEGTTDLGQMLNSISADYENRNLAGVVLVSDGIVNQGRSPVYGNYSYTLYPLALGDTVPKRDLSLNALLYNKIAYSGNRFPIVAEIRNEGFGPAAAQVLLRENGKVLERRQVQLNRNMKDVRVEFMVTASQVGKRHYEVVIEPQRGEFTTLNNNKHAYIDIIKGKIKVLLAAAAPHPDIKAIRAAIEENDNFETVLFIPGLEPLKQESYDLAVLHQIPSRTRAGQEALALVQQKKLPVLFVLGAQSDLNAFNQLNTGMVINRRGNQTDEVVPVSNPDFRKFRQAENAADRLAAYPPADVPFADFSLAPNTEVILQQQVGKLKTTKPLLVFRDNAEQRLATLVAENTWQWRLTEAAAHEKPETYDKLIAGLTQLLGSKENKKKLNVYPLQDEFFVSDDVRFGADVYNDIYEKIYGQNITLRLTDESGRNRSFTFVNAEGNSELNLGNLPGGVYKYTASADVSGKVQQDAGEFVVQELQLEALNALADHNLLYQLARKTDSRLYYPNQLGQLEQDILKADHKNVIYSTESLKDLVHLKWLFFAVLLLLSLEWFMRKYYGSY